MAQNKVTYEDIQAVCQLIGKGTPEDWSRAFSTVAYQNQVDREELESAYDRYVVVNFCQAGYDI